MLWRCYTTFSARLNSCTPPMSCTETSSPATSWLIQIARSKFATLEWPGPLIRAPSLKTRKRRSKSMSEVRATAKKKYKIKTLAGAYPNRFRPAGTEPQRWSSFRNMISGWISGALGAFSLSFWISRTRTGSSTKASLYSRAIPAIRSRLQLRPSRTWLLRKWTKRTKSFKSSKYWIHQKITSLKNLF